MLYRNDKHKAIFENAVRKKDVKNYTLMAVIYLLTADLRLWQIMKRHIEKNQIHFEQVRLNGINEDAYTLYCTAKDLYLGTKHLTVSDLADTDLISQKMFAVICNAMAVRRFGLNAIIVLGNQ